MSRDVILLFTDECGSYQKDRSSSFIVAHPFYVRANLIINLDDYLVLEKDCYNCKKMVGIDVRSEIKWSHYGNSIKKRNIPFPPEITSAELEHFYKESIKSLIKLKSAKVFFTITYNPQVKRIDEVKLIKMHLQNAFQRVQKEAELIPATAFVIADDLNTKNKPLKKAMFDLTADGDLYTKYECVNKGLFIDYSDQCCGLQLADICAGVFTAYLKYTISDEKERHKYRFAHDMFEQYLYSLIRTDNSRSEWDKVYGFGIRNVPNECGEEIAKKVSRIVQDLRHDELMDYIIKFDTNE